MIFECLGWCALNFGWCNWDIGRCIQYFGWLFGIVDNESYILEVISIYGGWVFIVWDGVNGILDCNYVILDNYLLYDGGNLVFLVVYLVF